MAEIECDLEITSDSVAKVHLNSDGENINVQRSHC